MRSNIGDGGGEAGAGLKFRAAALSKNFLFSEKGLRRNDRKNTAVM